MTLSTGRQEFRGRQTLCRADPNRERMEPRMEGLSKNFKALDEPGTGTAKRFVAIDKEQTLVTDAGQVAEAGLGSQHGKILTGARDVEPAAGDDEHFRVSHHHLTPGKCPRLLPLASEHFPATGEADNLWRPVARREGRIDPLQKHHPWRQRDRRRADGDGVDPRLKTGDSGAADLRHTSGIGHRLQADEHLGEALGLEVYHPRGAREQAGSGGYLRFGDRTDVAQALRHDQIGSESRKDLSVELVQRPLGAKSLADQFVDLSTAGIGGEKRPGHTGKAPDRRRVIALVAHAHKGSAEP